MTQAEIEAELLSQRQQLLQIAAGQEKREQDRRRFANVVTGIAIACFAVALIMGLVSRVAPAQAWSVFLLTSITLSFLAAALRL